MGTLAYPHKDFHLCQCFFGEHLINAAKTKPIALVESEKTALIASYYLPQFIWIASGGKNGCFNTKSLSVLKNRDVVLFPDLGATTVWQDKLLFDEGLKSCFCRLDFEQIISNVQAFSFIFFAGLML